jgi:hypothetical protein
VGHEDAAVSSEVVATLILKTGRILALSSWLSRWPLAAASYRPKLSLSDNPSNFRNGHHSEIDATRRLLISPFIRLDRSDPSQPNSSPAASSPLRPASETHHTSRQAACCRNP